MSTPRTFPGAGVRHFRSSALPPFERGVEFGTAFAPEVRATVRSYRDLLARCPRPDVDLADHGERAWTVIEQFSPAAAAEIHGIAVGAALPVQEVAGINARTELLALADPDGTVECSTVVSAPRPDGSGHHGPVRGAQTWDWYSAMSDGWLLWTIPFPDGRTVATVTEFGVLGKVGINDSGLGVLFSIVHHESDGGGRIGVPVHVLARTVLERAENRDTAIAVGRRARLSASSTLTLLDPAGTASLELFPAGSGVVEAEDGWLVRSNHFLSSEGAAGCRAHVLGQNSTARRRELTRRAGEVTRADDAGLVAALVGHEPDGPSCVHESPDSAEATLATVVVDTSSPRLSVWRGPPCAVPGHVLRMA